MRIVGCTTSATTNPSAGALRAGLELDIRNPSDPQEAFCQEPLRAYNNETFPVLVSWTQAASSNGTCQVDTQPHSDSRPLGPGQKSERLFCSHQTYTGSTCSVTITVSNVTPTRMP